LLGNEKDIAPTSLIVSVESLKQMARQSVAVSPPDCQDYTRVVFLLRPPSYCQAFKINTIMSNQNPGLTVGELQVFFVGPS